MLSLIPPKLTIFVSGTGAALSKLQILTQPSSFACIFFRSAPHTRLCFLCFSQILSQRLLFLPKPSFLPLFYPVDLCSLDVWFFELPLEGPVLSIRKGEKFSPCRVPCLHSGTVFSILSTLPPSPLSHFHLFSSTKQHSHQAPLWASESRTLSHIWHYFSRRLSVVALSVLQGGSKR